MRFSVVIPTYERPDRLSVCLDALSRVDYPPEAWEVIVVDDGSREPPEQLIRSFTSRLSARLVTQPNSGPAAARNRGAAEARGELLAFTDDDCAPDDQWLRAFDAQLTESPDTGLGGRVVNALPDQVCASASHLLLDYLYGYFNHSPDRIPLYATSNMAVPADQFRALGGFDETFPRAGGEDRDFCDRWVGAGHRWSYVPKATVTHAHPMSVIEFARQQFNYGVGARRYHQRRAQRTDSGLRVEPIEFYWDLLAYPFSAGARRPIVATGLLVLSQLANVAGFGWGLVNRRA